ncbi:uridine kinase [Streptomyces kanasensis]|uniref:uridine kinase family protein n=1 Tax=Streptomyces kanasensis TaxID=936756 RepID=UPI0036FC5664
MSAAVPAPGPPPGRSPADPGASGTPGAHGGLGALAGGLRALPPSCGPVRLVGVDGHAGSGKSTFAARLAAALGGAPVLHLDDLATHDELFAWTGRLREQVLERLSRGEAAEYHPYDWTSRRFAPPRRLPPAPVVLVEGVGAGRRAVRPHLARLLWMERPPEESWRRGRHRDGPGQSTFWDGWTVAETRHFAHDPSLPFADILVRECTGGYEWRPRRLPAVDEEPNRHSW